MRNGDIFIKNKKKQNSVFGFFAEKIDKCVVTEKKDTCDLYREYIEEALRERLEFHEDLWEKEGFKVNEVINLLKLISANLFWPNINFIPDDPIEAVFCEGEIAEFGCKNALLEIKNTYGKEIDVNLFAEIKKNNIFNFVKIFCKVTQ